VVNEGGEREWNWWVVTTIHDYERTKPKQHPVGITGHGSERIATMLESPADWLSPGRADGYAEEPPAWQGGKVSLLDTDHIWGVGGNPGWVWKSFLRGHNPIFMDPYDGAVLGKPQDSQWEPIRRAMGVSRRLAERVNLAAMTPRGELAGSGYCLASPGKEYVAYLPDGSEATVDLSAAAGPLKVEWIHPVEGTIQQGGEVAGGARRSFKAPFTGGAVLYLRADSDPPAQKKPNGAQTDATKQDARSGWSWLTATPESQGMSSQKLEALRDSLASHKTTAFLVVRNDKIVYEWYAAGQGPTTKHYTASMAKAIGGGLSTAVAMSDGRIAPDDRAAKYVPQWKDDPRKSKITIRQLGSHTSGIEDAEADNLPHDKLTGWKGDFWKQLAPPRDPFTLSRDAAPALFEPGEKMQYSNPGIAMLTYCVTAALRDAPHKDIRSLLRDRIMRPIGVPDEEWTMGYGKTYTVDGLPLVGAWGGASYTARAVARVGQLMLHKGSWEGKQLLSKDTVRQVTSDAGTPGDCGIGWWSNNSGLYAKVPRDAFWGSGAGHQIVLIVPSLNLVTVRNGEMLEAAPGEPNLYHEPVRRLLFEPLVEAISDSATSAKPASADVEAVPLPPGVKAVWDLSKAYRETTPTRERICINGLWRWQPADASSQQAPVANWGYFKVPGCWPGIGDYMQKDSQTMYAHPSWKNQRLGGVTAAWYERDITIPADWAGRRIALCIEYLNSYAAVYVDGKRAGEIRFPAGELDLSSACQPGSTHRLSLLVGVLPLKGVMLSYTDSASAREVKGTVARRGLCGDVFLTSTPAGPQINDLRVDTSVRRRDLTLDAAIDGLATNARYALRSRVLKDGKVAKEFTSRTFQSNDLKEGRIASTEQWMPDKLWDTHTPQNTYDLEVSLLDGAGKVLDTAAAVRFGFREFWIDGRDFFLNGTRIFLSAVPVDNAAIGAALATYQAARESLERLQSFGINFVYTHNYGCEPGSHLSFAEILRAADDVGMLVSFSQPHFSHYDWQAPDADQSNGYARHAEFYVRAAQNHPSVVAYSMSHNATGYEEDMNPDLIDGIHDPRETWGLRNAKLALRAEEIVKHLDPSRIVYHHASGNLGSMHAINFYPNFVPIQELSDWFKHWATQGVKPVFTCEYGAPFTWDWTMYRGWYKDKREFGSAVVPWEFCLAEWNAQFFGDRAFRISEPEKANLRWEAKQFQAGRLWHRWDYPVEVGSTRFEERYPVFAMYLTDNWRAFRTWGVSANSPWEYGHFWKLRDGVDRSRKDFQVDWDNLQRPGFSPDYVEQRYERMDLAYERSDWIATEAAQALIRNNRPLLAYIAGKPAGFTGKDHNFHPGETVEKQVVVINNSREAVTCDYAVWALAHQAGSGGEKPAPKPVTGDKTVTVAAGQQARVPLRLELPATPRPVRYELIGTFAFSTGETQADSFFIDVLPLPPKVQTSSKIALFDPKGQTGELLSKWGAQYQYVEAGTDLSVYDILVIGKSALTVGGPAPDVTRVRDGLKVVVFEQTADVLEKRFGFRSQEYGLRQIFARVSDHPILAGLTGEHLRDWRGEATIVAPRLTYESRPRYGPTVQWCGIPVTQAWRCGNRGNVASVLIEKPACGDFLPILDGGYSLQYSPLMEYREGKGMVLFCQMDVTGRTETDTAADVLVHNLLQYVSTWKPAPRRQVVYVGDPAGRRHLESTGLSPAAYESGSLSPDRVLVVGPGGGRELASHTTEIADWLKTGGHLLVIGLDQDEANTLLPFKVAMKKAEHIAAYFEPFARNSLLTGVGPADVHNRDPRELPLISGGAQIIGDGVLAKAEQANVVFCQLAPWQFEGVQSNLRRTHRRVSFLVSRLLANMGAVGSTPLLDRFHQPVDNAKPEQRWLNGFYLDQPEEWDNPYRFFRW
jgi:CubicO group peptidase (beta-lactamase class C family)